MLHDSHTRFFSMKSALILLIEDYKVGWQLRYDLVLPSVAVPLEIRSLSSVKGKHRKSHTLWPSRYLYLSRWWRSRTLFISARDCVWLFQSVTGNLGSHRLRNSRQKCWILLFNITMGMVWLQRDTVLPQQRMIIVCHPYCQAAWVVLHPLQGQVVDLREGHRKVSEKPSHILSRCCQSKAPSGENPGK